MRFSAGAVNPDRNERNWIPGYNLINLKVTGTGAERALEIDAHVLQWQSSPELFRPILTRQGNPIYHHKILIPEHIPSAIITGYKSKNLFDSSVAITAVQNESHVI